MPRRRQTNPPLWLTAVAMIGAFAVSVAIENRRDKRHAARRGKTDGRAFGQSLSTDEPRALHLARAHEVGRGRRAESPFEIPKVGWKDVALRTWQQFNEDRLLAVAAGVVFYGLLALFPAIAALVSFYGLFADAASVGGHLAFAAALMPEGAFAIVQEQATRIARGGGGLSIPFIMGLLLAIWSANAGMKAMIDALNVIYDEEEKRSFVRLNLLSLAMTVGAIAVLLLAIGAVIVFPFALDWLGLASRAEGAISLLRWPVLMLLLIAGLAVLYRFGPSRRQAQWKWLSVGSVVTAILWIVGSSLLSLYLSRFADYNATYGSLGAGIGLMMWLWLTSSAILLGAEINSEIEHQTARDTTIGCDKPLGRRGAAMADTVGEAQA